MSCPFRTLWILIALFVAPSALAADGVVEINQTCAVTTGCFAGDTAGYPVQIVGAAGHSYRLTSDLKIPDENTHGIQISTSNISIDLAGFEISGPVVCSGTPTTCTPSTGSGTGVFVTSLFDFPGTAVRNGAVGGMGDGGLSLSSQSEVQNVRVRWNRRSGITIGSGSIVSGSTVFQNGGDGISSFSGSTLSGNSIYQNGVRGIFGGRGMTITGNSVYGNALSGIATVDGATVSGNSVRLNGGPGIFVSFASTVSGNSVANNGSGGIVTDSGCAVLGNAVGNNVGFGLTLGSQSGYRENVIAGNSAGTVDGVSIVNLGNNACNGSPACP